MIAVCRSVHELVDRAMFQQDVAATTSPSRNVDAENAAHGVLDSGG